jgi:uncharacterized membrane-anchored protein
MMSLVVVRRLAKGAIIAITAAAPFTAHAMTDFVPTTRGAIQVDSDQSYVFSRDEYCDIAISDWGWQSCEFIDAMVVAHVPGADTTVVNRPNTDGYVRFDDWDTDQRREAVSSIEEQLVAGAKAQSEATGSDIQFAGWRTQPTLNKSEAILYYATDYIWDGETVTNIKATVFDRHGYVEFMVVPLEQSISGEDIEDLVLKTLESYAPEPMANYASFQPGDTVAVAGAVGVLATMTGTKWGKAATASVVAVALAFLKKAGVVLLLPFVWIGSLFRRKKD